MLEKVVQEVFGFESLRPLQQQAIDAVLARRDCVVVMPTGGGKSLCYQAPALVSDGITLVISPLIALMKDQADALREYGVVAAYWNSSLSPAAVSDLIAELRQGVIKLLYIAPERFTSPQFLAVIKDLRPSLIAVDEAHCVSEWGHDFRQEYRNLSVVKRLFPGVPCIALTATATGKVVDDVCSVLCLDNPVHVRGSFDRPNLFYTVRPKSNAYDQIVQFLRQQDRGPGIIYCTSRKRVEETAEGLKADGFTALPYHAGLSHADRARHQEDFIRDKVQIIVATIAFGMGIDKSNVRFVIHHDLPKSLEAYYQETGRAGRDGAPSECVLFFSYADKFVIESFIAKMENTEERKLSTRKLDQLVDFASRRTCRRRSLLGYFGEKYPHHACRGCDVCCGDVRPVEATEISYKILSAVLRLQEKYGARMVIDVLRGVDAPKIKDIGADKLSVYGIAQDVSVEYLRTVIDALVGIEFLVIENGDYPVLKVSDKARQALRAREKITLPLAIPEATKTVSAPRKLFDYDDELFAALRVKRRALADEANIPPYMVFHDSVLEEMAYAMPITEEELLRIAGVGRHKAQTFGKAILSVIQLAVTQRGLVRQAAPKTTGPKTATGRQRLQDVHTKLQEGLSPAGIAELLSISEGVVFKYIEDLVTDKKIIDLSPFMSEATLHTVHSVLQKNPNRLLRDIKAELEALGEGCGYEVIRLVRAAKQVPNS